MYFFLENITIIISVKDIHSLPNMVKISTEFVPIYNWKLFVWCFARTLIKPVRIHNAMTQRLPDIPK